MDLNVIISISGTIVGFLALVIIAIKHRRNSYQKFLFLLFLFSLTYNCFLIFLTQSGVILEYPHFYRTASPFVYAAPIAMYLLGKAIGKNQERPPRMAFLLLAIPTLHFLELLPFYLKSSADKLAFLENVVTDPDVLVFGSISLLPNSWHYVLQLGLGALLMGITFTKTLKYRQNLKKSSRFRKLSWINRISLLLSVSNIILLMLLVADSEHFAAYTYGSLLFTFALLIIFVSLFLEPGILYGTKLTSNGREQAGPKTIPITLLESMEDRLFTERLERYFTEESGFLDPYFRQQDLADHLGISRNELSHRINSIYRKNFNQLLNEKRIEVALKNLDDSRWDHLNLQGVAREVGFKSRTTFNKAFKMKTGLTPSEYKTA